MKKTLKLAGLLLALVMVISALPIMASAADKTITVTQPEGAQVDGETYHAYQMLTIDTSTGSTADDTFASATYYVSDAWKPFFETGAGAAYFELGDVSTDGKQYVVLQKDTDGEDIEIEDSDMADLAKAALAYATATGSGITAAATATAADGEAVLTVPADGWYLVDSTVGTICMITNNAPTVEIEDKNNVPTIDKDVDGQETVTGAKVGDTVTFTVTISAKPGAENYVLHDVMEAGLTYRGDAAVTGLEAANYTVKTGTDVTDGCTFEIVFAQSYLDTIEANTDLTVTYTALVNENAVLAAGDANSNDLIDNTATLTFGDKQTTEDSTASVKTRGFSIVKTDEDNKIIDGAVFNLFDGATQLSFIKDGNNYRVAKSGETGAVTDISAGIANIDGLDADKTYTLKEITPPAGYNRLTSDISVTVSDDDFCTSTLAVGGDYTPADSTADPVVAGDGGTQIVNKQGSVLPETGGMGTTLLYVVGAILVIGAGVLLVSKKRMAAK